MAKNSSEEVLSMRIRRFSKAEFLVVLREEGIVVDYTVMDFARFVMKCQRYGFDSSQFSFLFF